MPRIAFGPTIRLLRQAKGISLREMARKLGVSPAFLSQIEAGRQHKIPKARIVQVAKMLGVSEDYLLGTAGRIHPEVVDFLRETPEAAEFMITAVRSGLVAKDFSELREAVKAKTGKRPLRRAKVPGAGKKKKVGGVERRQGLEGILDPSLCLTSLSVQNKSRLFQRFVKLVSKKHKPITGEVLLEKLEKRELQAPTSVGGGVAIPHAFLPHVDNPIIGAVQLKRAIQFNPANEEKVKTVFFLVGNEDGSGDYISILARIARLCSDSGFLHAFSRAKTSRELYRTIIQWDKRIGGM